MKPSFANEHIVCHSYPSSLPNAFIGRAMGYDSASFELEDRPAFENFLDGIGFAYALALVARVCRFDAWPNIAHPITSQSVVTL